MRNQQLWKKAAKKSISWLLILGMLVTLPQFPTSMTQVMAAELEVESVDAETTESSEMEVVSEDTEEETDETETSSER